MRRRKQKPLFVRHLQSGSRTSANWQLRQQSRLTSKPPQALMMVPISHVFFFATFLLARNIGGTPITNNGSLELEQSSSRVVNGEPVRDKDEFPFVVDLSLHDVAISSSRFCTGTLIKNNVILTAAHCVLNDGYSSPVFATVGRVELDDKHSENMHTETFRTIASMVHPEYSGLGSPNDVALMLLNDSSSAKPVKLAGNTPDENKKAWVVGYGIQKIGTLEAAGQMVQIMSRRLQKTELRIKDKSFCDIPDANIRTQEGMLCTEGIKEGSSACKGDSGGGLFLRKAFENAYQTEQVGIVSYGDSQCLSQDSGVFTDVASVRDWIESSAAKLRKAFHPDDIQVGDMDGKPIIRRGMISSHELSSRFMLSGSTQQQQVKFYRIRTDFKKGKQVTVSLCDGPKRATTRLHVTSDADNRVLSDAGSCPGGSQSRLTFRAGKGNFIVGVSSNTSVPFKMAVSSAEG